MKPTSILLSIVLGLVSLSVIVWIGQMSGSLEKLPDPNLKKPIPTVEDLPMPESGPYGKAEVEEKNFEFGTRMVGSHDEHTFTLKNVGEGPLQFKLGKASCQCTGVEVSKVGGDVVPEDTIGSIAPGESIHILIKWKMVSIMPKFQHGAPLYTTDPDQRTIQFNVTGSVDSPFRILPDGVWNLGEMSVTEPTRAEGIVTSTVYSDFTLSEEPRENPKVTVMWEPMSSEERGRLNKDDDGDVKHPDKRSGYKVKIAAGPDVPAGPFRESVKLKAVAGDYEQILEFSVSGTRSGPISVRGATGGARINLNSNRLVFPDFPAEKGSSTKITMFIKGMTEDLVLKSVEPENPRVKVNLHSTDQSFGNAKSYLLEVEILPGPPVRHRLENAEQMTLHLNHPESPDFKLLLDYNATR